VKNLELRILRSFARCAAQDDGGVGPVYRPTASAAVILNGEAREESQVTHFEILRALRRSG
jgi:hypothetical protein